MDAGPPHSVQRRVGNSVNQRFSGMQSQCWRGLCPHQPDLQGFERRRPAGRETLRQLFQGAGTGIRNRALPKTVGDCGNCQRSAGCVRTTELGKPTEIIKIKTTDKACPELAKGSVRPTRLCTSSPFYGTVRSSCLPPTPGPDALLSRIPGSCCSKSLGS